MGFVHKNCRIAYGCTRTVLLIGSWVIKIPSVVEWRLFLYGLLANIQERRFSKTGWPELCPVLWALPGGWLIIMRRAEPLTREQFMTFDIDGFREKPGHLITGVENKMDSFGWIDGRIVAVDYGSQGD